MKTFVDFEGYRKDLADDIKKTKEEEGREVAQEKLQKIKATPDYKTTKLFHSFAQQSLPPITTLPGEIKSREKVAHGMENIDKWEVEELNSKIPPMVKDQIDWARRQELVRLINLYKVGGERITKQFSYDRLKDENTKAFDSLSEEEKEEIGVKKQVQYKKVVELYPDLINIITGGKYLDLRNLNHAIGGATVYDSFYDADYVDTIGANPITRGTLTGNSFELNSSIRPGENNNFHVVTGQNPWAGVHKDFPPLAIISPNNPKARNFFRDSFNPKAVFPIFGTREYGDLQKYLKSIREFDEDGKFVGFKVKENIHSGGYLNRLLFLCEQPVITTDNVEGFKNTFSEEYLAQLKKSKGGIYSWADIADTIVDLPTGKLYKRKYTETEQKEAEEDMDQYKEELRKILD